MSGRTIVAPRFSYAAEGIGGNEQGWLDALPQVGGGCDQVPDTTLWGWLWFIGHRRQVRTRLRRGRAAIGRGNMVRRQRPKSGKAARGPEPKPSRSLRWDAPGFEESGGVEEAGSRGEAANPATDLNHEEEFERAWTDPRNTRVELPAVDINLVLAKYYRMNEPLTFTRTMLWDMEVKKAYRPDLYIPSVVLEGSARYWRRRAAADGAESFVRCSQQRLWLEPSERGLVLEQVFLNPTRQSATFIGAATLVDHEGNVLRAGDTQPLFHVEHSVDGDDSRPLNRWRIVYLTGKREQELIERFTHRRRVWLREFVEIYIRTDLGIDLTRKKTL